MSLLTSMQSITRSLREESILATKRDRGHRTLGLPGGFDLEIEPNQLILDPENFRLLDRTPLQRPPTPIDHYAQPSTQSRVRSLLSESRYDLQALVRSVKTNGFLDH